MQVACYFLKNKRIEIRIDPQNGMNVESIRYAGKDYIDCDWERKQAGATYGIPILYPTPNRVKNGTITFENRTIQAKMHGFLKNTDLSENVTFSSSNTLRWSMRFAPGTKLYEQYPFSSLVTFEIALKDYAVEWQYWIENTGEHRLPYSLALHPFFIREPDTLYRVNAEQQMEADDQKYPTGRILNLTDSRLAEWRNVEAEVYDTVFCVTKSPMSEILYPQRNTKLTLCASKEFAHCVVFTPPEKKWFCLEPQTSSVDCHNLYNAGFEKEANLQIVQPGKVAHGWVQLVFAPCGREELGPFTNEKEAME